MLLASNSQLCLCISQRREELRPRENCCIVIRAHCEEAASCSWRFWIGRHFLPPYPESSPVASITAAAQPPADARQNTAHEESSDQERYGGQQKAHGPTNS